MTFAEFAAANRKRCEAHFERKIGADGVLPFTLGVAEEAGEVVGAVRGHLGITKRKSVTAEDIGDEIGDLIAYADLLVQCFGLSLEDVIRRKFNKVSERIGSEIRLDDPTVRSS